jgi:anthranilate phosphoribosyltransferase
LRRELDEAGICFLHAPLFNPAMKNVAPVRKSLRVKTFFNMLGPMVNPSSPRSQLVGVFSLELARLYSYIYQQSDTQYTIVHSLDGYDEVSLTGDVKVISRDREMITSPEEMGFNRVDEEKLFGGNSVKEAAGIFMDILNGNGTVEQNDVVVANAGLGLKVLNPSKDEGECFEKARRSLYEKKALNAFKKITA